MDTPSSSPSAGLFEQIARDGQSASSMAEFRNALLRAVLQKVGGDSSAIMDLAPRSQRFASCTGAIGSSAGYVDQYMAHRARYDDSLSRLLRVAHVGGAAIDTDVYTRRERESLAAYVEVLLPQGARSILAGLLCYGGRATGLIVLKRHCRGHGFQIDDAAALRELLPAVALADAGFRYTLRGPPLEATLPHRQLSPREAQVAAFVAKGLQNPEIALLLGTSRHTVKKQVQKIMGKLEVSNRTELAGTIGSGQNPWTA
jgi:DNA-binding CsgD family transcriptional regulator